MEASWCKPGLGDAYGILLTPTSEMSICFSEIRLHERFILSAAELAKTASLNQMCQSAPVVGFADAQEAGVHQVWKTSFQPDRGKKREREGGRERERERARERDRGGEGERERERERARERDRGGEGERERERERERKEIERERERDIYIYYIYIRITPYKMNVT